MEDHRVGPPLALPDCLCKWYWREGGSGGPLHKERANTHPNCPHHGTQMDQLEAKRRS